MTYNFLILNSILVWSLGYFIDRILSPPHRKSWLLPFIFVWVVYFSFLIDLVNFLVPHWIRDRRMCSLLLSLTLAKMLRGAFSFFLLGIFKIFNHFVLFLLWFLLLLSFSFGLDFPWFPIPWNISFLFEIFLSFLVLSNKDYIFLNKIILLPDTQSIQENISTHWWKEFIL